MARNVEIKARIANVEALLSRAAALASEGPLAIAQDDTFFRCESGRLKLRDFLNGSGELIFYRRANQSGPKESFYLRSVTSTPGVLRESLSLAYGQAGRVVKHRTLFLVGRTRVHFDRVEGLGHFLELEVVLEENEPSEAGVREAHDLMSRLGIELHQLVEGAYIELLGREGLESTAVESIICYSPISDVLATAGQPSEAQLETVAAAGFQVVINLALHDDPRYSLKNERVTVTSLGMEYIHIPVPFSAPTRTSLLAFFEAMEHAGKRKVFLHCAHNKRVPVLVALHRIIKQGWSQRAALAAMREVWQPDATWENFIAQTLRDEVV